MSSPADNLDRTRPGELERIMRGKMFTVKACLYYTWWNTAGWKADSRAGRGERWGWEHWEVGVRWQQDVHKESRGLERELMGNTAAAQTRGAVRQQWPDTAEGLRGVPGLLEQDKGLFGEGILSMVQWATAQAWHQLKGKIGRRSSSTLNKNNKLPSPPKGQSGQGASAVKYCRCILHSVVCVGWVYDEVQCKG